MSVSSPVVTVDTRRPHVSSDSLPHDDPRRFDLPAKDIKPYRDRLIAQTGSSILPGVIYKGRIYPARML